MLFARLRVAPAPGGSFVVPVLDIFSAHETIFHRSLSSSFDSFSVGLFFTAKQSNSFLEVPCKRVRAKSAERQMSAEAPDERRGAR